MSHYTIVIFHGLGDCVNATTVLRPLKEAVPDCKVRWVTHPLYAGVVENNPLVDEVELLGGYESLPGIKAREGTRVFAPAPYLSDVPRNMVGLGDSLLGRYLGFLRGAGLSTDRFEPLLHPREEEVVAVDAWLRERVSGRFILVETAYGSQQSFWDDDLTMLAVGKIRDAGMTPIIAHKTVLPGLLGVDLPYRLLPSLYNRAAGFVGVSSGISCLVHTQSCRKDVPHLEFVRGDHWATTLYAKDRKRISYDRGEVAPLLDWMIAEAK